MNDPVKPNKASHAAKPIKSILLAGVLSLGLMGCENGGNETFGTLLGAGLGAWLGSEIGGHGDSQVVGAAIGTMIGAGIGSSVGRKLDEADQMRMEQAYYDALEYTPSGQTSEWHNPDSGNHGTYEPQPAYQKPDGRYCREFTQEIWVAGEKQQGYGTACRQEDGTWEIVSD